MQVIELPINERVQTGCSHVAIIDYTDLNSTAALTKTLTPIFEYLARDLVDKVFFDLITAFAGTGITNLSLKFGWNGTASDDDDGLIASVELAGAATEILAGDGTGAAFATLRTGFAAQEAGNLEALFTAIGANLTALTAGKLRIYFNVVRMSKLRGINGT